MKKILFTTTALVAAGLIAGPALADKANDSFDPIPSQPAGVTLDLGGFYKAGFGYLNEDADSTQTGVANQRGYAVKHDVEVYFTGETTLENGLTVGARVELNTSDDRDLGASTDTQDANGDEKFAYFRGAFGEVRAGNEDGARRLLSVQAPQGSNVFGSGDSYISFGNIPTGSSAAGVATFTNFTGENDTVQGLGVENEDAAKLIYFTPNWNGFTLGASFAPDANGSGNNNVGLTDTESTSGNVFDIAAIYEGQTNNLGYKLSAGYTVEDSGVVSTASVDDEDAYSLGLNLMWNQWTFGGSYGRFNNVDEVANEDAAVWDLGVTYETGPYIVGLSGSFGDYDESTTQEVEYDTYVLSGTYNLGQGIDLTAAIQYHDLDFNVAGENNYDSTGFMVGTDIRF